MNPNTALVRSTHAQLYTTIYPKQDAQTVVLLHGGPGVPMDDSPIAELLQQKFQVITFDQRGTGRSPAEGASYAIEEYLEDLNTIAHHFGVEQFHLFGHSWGGLYGQIYAENHPEKVLSLFLSSPSSGTGQMWTEAEREVMAFNKKHSGFWGWSQMGVRSLLGTLGFDSAYQSLFKQVLENYNKEFDPNFVASAEMVEHVRAEPINKTRPHIVAYPLLKDEVKYNFPVIVVYGEKDIYGASKRYVKRRYPEATFIEVENAGHIAWRHTPKRFAEIVVKFYGLQEQSA
jgi:proline iminopeptidase